MNISSWLTQAKQTLNASASATLDAEVLLCFVLDCDRSHVYAWPDKTLSQAQLQQLTNVLQRRQLGEPIAYITGTREFWSLELDVCEDVLVPRPDTELIVEMALAAISDDFDGVVLDAGTGSGAIAIALSHEWKSTKKTGALPVVASDLSLPALRLAQRNAQKHQLNNIDFVQSQWLNAFHDNAFSLIISNPPYLSADDPHLDDPALQYEPLDALVAGEDGLDDIRELIVDALRAGVSGCRLLIEHGATQAMDVRRLMNEAAYKNVQTHQDLPGKDRVTSGICP